MGELEKNFYGKKWKMPENGLVVRFLGIISNHKVGKKREDLYGFPWYTGIVKIEGTPRKAPAWLVGQHSIRKYS